MTLDKAIKEEARALFKRVKMGCMKKHTARNRCKDLLYFVSKNDMFKGKKREIKRLLLNTIKELK